MKNIVYLVVIVIIIQFGCGGKMENNNDNFLVDFAIYPTSIASESYLITVNKSSKYTIKRGTRDISQTDVVFLDIVKEEKTIFLDEIEINGLVDLLNEFNKTEDISEEALFLDGWGVYIETKEKKIIINYSNVDKYNTIKEIIEMLMDLSPIKINIHSWS
jgi:hypothetical protein